MNISPNIKLGILTAIMLSILIVFSVSVAIAFSRTASAATASANAYELPNCSDHTYILFQPVTNWILPAGSIVKQGLTPIQACHAYVGSTQAVYRAPVYEGDTAGYDCYGGLTSINLGTIKVKDTLPNCIES